MRTLCVVLALLAVSSRSDGCFFWTGGCNDTSSASAADTRASAPTDDERIVNNPPGGANAAVPSNVDVASDLLGLLNGAVASGTVEGLPGGNVGIPPPVAPVGGSVGVPPPVAPVGGSVGIPPVEPVGGSVGAPLPDGPPCKDPSGKPGVCVPYYLCHEGDVITDGAGLIDVRFGNTCPEFLQVCCKHVVPEPPTPPPYVSSCGRKNSQGIDIRITGFKDNEAQFAEFPWMVAILRVERVGDKEVNLYACGGSLIHPSVVLTAAHCVNGKAAGDLKVRLGEWDTQRTYERYPHQDRRVVKKTLHPHFNSGALYNDFALLFLDAPAELAPNVDTVCLPDAFSNFEGQTCYATGWGRDNFGKEGKFQNVLKEVALPVVANPYCEAQLRTTRLGQYFQLHNSFVCAGGEAGLDTCKGDGGSPLVCQAGSGPFVQVGIVAWGIGCGQDGVPGVYANVPFGSQWIKEQADLGLQELYGVTGYRWAYDA